MMKVNVMLKDEDVLTILKSAGKTYNGVTLYDDVEEWCQKLVEDRIDMIPE